MPECTIYHSNSIGNKANCLYPHKVTVTDEMSFKKAVSKDHICAQFQNDYRSEKNFISAVVYAGEDKNALKAFFVSSIVL